MRTTFLLLSAIACGPKANRPTWTGQPLSLANLDVQGPTGAWAPGEPPAPLPIGAWIQVADQIAYTYLDWESGPSAAWDSDGVRSIRRLTYAPAQITVLEEAEHARLGLPAVPSWLDKHYGPQPPRGTLWGSWRSDPRLAGRFHPDFPDDLRVLVGAVPPAESTVELVWISLRDCDPERCEGVLLNQPDQVPLSRGDTVAFRWADLTPQGLPPAAARGSLPSPALLRRAQGADLGPLQQDDLEWTTDTSLPPAERLLPMSQWVWVGSSLAFVHLGEHGPLAAVFNGQGIQSQSLTWKPRGMRVLTEEERRELKLPDSPLKDPTGQPAPGDWGLWRLDPRLSDALRTSDPDVLFGTLALPEGTVAPATVVQVRVFSGTGDALTGRALTAAPHLGLEVGDEVLIPLTDLHEGLPVVVPLSAAKRRK